MRPSRLPRPTPTIVGAALAIALAIVAAGASGAAPVFPGTSNVGIEPPPGMRVMAEANGFRAGAAIISISELLPKNSTMAPAMRSS